MIQSAEHGRHRKAPSTARHIAGMALRLALVASAAGPGGAGAALFAEHIVAPYAESLMPGSHPAENPRPKAANPPKAHEMPPQILNIAAFSAGILDEAFSAPSGEFGYSNGSRTADISVPIGKLSCLVSVTSTETLSGSVGESLPDPSHATDVQIGCLKGSDLKLAEFKDTRKGWLVELGTIPFHPGEHEKLQQSLLNSPDATTLIDRADSYAMQTLQRIQMVFTPPPPPQLLAAESS